jgi:hypothetical protein
VELLHLVLMDQAVAAPAAAGQAGQLLIMVGAVAEQEYLVKVLVE